jgi:hypothetical protein
MMSDTYDHELATMHTAPDLEVIEDVDLHSLPPVDRGKIAWLTLAACFFLEAAVWGCAEHSGVTWYPASC